MEEIEITTQESVTRKIKITYPVYCRQYIDSEYRTTVIYLKIDRTEAISITERDSENQYELSKSQYKDIKNSGFGGYLVGSEKDYKSDEKSFLDAKQRALDFLNSL